MGQIRRSKQEKLVYYMIVIYLVVMSGSVWQRAEMAFFQKCNIYVLVFTLLFLFAKSRTKFSRFPVTLTSVFLLFSMVSSIFICIYWMETRNVLGYVANIGLLVVPYIISKELNRDYFIDIYINVITIIAAISIVSYYFTPILAILPSYEIPIGGYLGGYKCYMVYSAFMNNSLSVYDRNIGIFWEPGMFQGYLVFAMIVLSMRTWSFRTLIAQIILGIAVISTKSTTGYILLIAVMAFYFLKISDKFEAGKLFVTAVLCVSLIVIFCFPSLPVYILRMFPENVVGKLFSTENMSTNTRWYGLISDATLALKYPLGVGKEHLNELRAVALEFLQAKTDGSDVNTNISMMLYYGLLPGILFLMAQIRACNNMTSNVFEAFLMNVVMITILNTEPHYLTMLFTTILFMYANDKGKFFKITNRSVEIV